MLFTRLTEEELRAVFSHYDFGLPVESEILGGLANTNMRILTDSGVRALLKVCNDKTFDELIPQMQLLEHLRKHGYPTALPIPTKYGEHIVRLEKKEQRDVPPIVLYEFVKGKSPTEANVPIMAQIGMALGKLHLIPSLPILGTDYPLGILAMDDMVKSSVGTAFENHHFIDLLKKYLPKLKEDMKEELPSGIIHMDLFLDNTIFDGDQLQAVVDFEEVIHSPYLIDVATAIIGCCFVGDELHYPFVESLLREYAKYRKLGLAEIRLLPAYVRYTLLGMAFWRFRQFNLRNPTPEYFDHYQQFTRRLPFVHDDLFTTIQFLSE